MNIWHKIASGSIAILRIRRQPQQPGADAIVHISHDALAFFGLRNHARLFLPTGVFS
jgi:hypothetical protein